MSIPGSASPLFFTAAADAAAFTLERSVRFDNDSSAHFKRTPSSAGDQQTWTWSAWIKGCTGVGDQILFFSGDYNALNDYVYFGIMNTGFFRVEIRDGTTLSRNNTNNKLRDPAAWYHIVVQANFSASAAADRMNVWINNEEVSWLADDRSDITTSFDYAINKSGKEHAIGALKDSSYKWFFNGYMADVYLIDGSALDPTSFGAYDDNGVWQAAAYSGSFGTNGFHLDFADNSTAAALGTDTSGNGNDWSVSNFSVSQGDQVYSSGASYEGNAVLYSNEPAGAFGKPGIPDWGVTYSPSGSPSLTSGGKITFPTAITNVTSVVINYKVSGGSGSVFINDNSTGITNLGSTSYVEVDVTSALSNSSTSTTLSSIIFGPGNQNYGMRLKYIEVNGVRLTDSTYNYLNDSLLDSPTNGTQSDTGAGGEVSGNYATLNPLVKHNTTSPIFSNGNLEITDTGQSGYNNAISTIGVSSGKWYVECTNVVGAYNFVGIQSGPVTGGYIGNDANGWGYAAEGYLRHNSTNTSYGSVTYGADDVIGIALDLDSATKTLTFYKNGTSLGTAYSGSDLDADVYHFGGTLYTTNDKQIWNFGQRAFAYSAPSGFKALCTTNLPTPTIANGRDHFDAKLYTGNGTSASSTQAITGFSFSPNLVWMKARSVTAASGIYDTVRGVTERLASSKTAVYQNEGYFESFDSNGFTVKGNSNNTNANNETYVAWCWNIPGSASSNTDGTITSSVTKNADAGISIVTWTGNDSTGTIGHGLGSKPDIIIAKVYGDTTYSDNWPVYSSVFDGTHYAYLNDTRKFTDFAGFWNDGTATSTVFPVGTYNTDNTKSLWALCFTSVAGFSSFGSYEGNASDDGPFVYTGFRPAFVLTKWADGIDQWQIHDTSRSPDNVASEILIPNTTSDEKTYVYSEIDILSNGFKLRNSNQNINAASTYIYAAFAENPFQANGGLAR